MKNNALNIFNLVFVFVTGLLTTNVSGTQVTSTFNF